MASRGGGAVPREAHNLETPVQFRPPQQKTEKRCAVFLFFVASPKQKVKTNMPKLHRSKFFQRIREMLHNAARLLLRKRAARLMRDFVAHFMRVP